MAAGDIKRAYAAASSLTVTNLHSLAASATYVGGWESGAIENASNKYRDYSISAKLVTHASNRQAGALRMYLFAQFDDASWPDAMDGTESTESWTDEEERDAGAILAAEIAVDNSASATYTLNVPSVKAVFGGNMPEKFGIFITGNATTTTTAQLASSGSTVHIKGSYDTVAQS